MKYLPILMYVERKSSAYLCLYLPPLSDFFLWLAKIRKIILFGARINFDFAALGFTQMSTKRYFEQLLWLGSENWGGILLVEEEEAEQMRAMEEHDAEGEDRTDNAATGGDNDNDAVEVDGVRAISSTGVSGRDDDDDDIVDGKAASSRSMETVDNSDEDERQVRTQQGSLAAVAALSGRTSSSSSSVSNKGGAKQKKSQSEDEYSFLDFEHLGKKRTKTSSSISSPGNPKDRTSLRKQGDYDDGTGAADNDDDDDEGGRYADWDEFADDGGEDGDYEQDHLYGDTDAAVGTHSSDRRGGGAGAAGAAGEAVADPLLLKNWNLASYLPPAAAEYFHFIVGTIHSLCRFSL